MVQINGIEIPEVGLLVAIVAIVAFFFLLNGGGSNEDKKKQSKKNQKIALDPNEYQPFKLIEIETISDDVKRFRFGLQSPEHILGLPIGQHISFKYYDAEDNNAEVIRSYTPTTSDDEIGYVDFVIKVYRKNIHPKFPNGGKMSQHLESLKLGDTMLMRGPKGHLEYLGNGSFTIKKKNEITTYQKKKIGMIAGGTGITPMLQIIRAILKNPKDQTQLWLIFANQTENDILLRQELEAIPSNRLKLFYTVDRPSEGWKHGVGFINKEMCQNHLPPAGEDSVIFLCGPPPMIKFACEPALKELNFQESDWFAF